MKALRITLIALLCLTGLFLVVGLTGSDIPWDHKLSENEVAALSQMRSMMSAQELYYERNGSFAPSLQALFDAKLLREPSIDRYKSTYVFNVRLISPDVWEGTAAPTKPGETGRRWFYTSSIDSKLRMKWYEPADSTSFCRETGEGDANGPSFIHSWVYRERIYLVGLWMAFRTGVVTFCVFVLYMLLKVLGVGQPQGDKD